MCLRQPNSDQEFGKHHGRDFPEGSGWRGDKRGRSETEYARTPQEGAGKAGIVAVEQTLGADEMTIKLKGAYETPPTRGRPGLLGRASLAERVEEGRRPSLGMVQRPGSQP